MRQYEITDLQGLVAAAKIIADESADKTVDKNIQGTMKMTALRCAMQQGSDNQLTAENVLIIAKQYYRWLSSED